MGGAGMASANLELGRYSPQTKTIIASAWHNARGLETAYLAAGNTQFHAYVDQARIVDTI
jgi:hypothetical protein